MSAPQSPRFCQRCKKPVVWRKCQDELTGRTRMECLNCGGITLHIKRARKAKTKKPFKLGPDDHVVTAWAENCAGPGWANHPVWVLVRSAQAGKLHMECIQPAEQSAAMVAVFPFSALASASMRAAVENLLRPARGRDEA